MNRIDQIFTQYRARKRKALMPYLTAGDPNLALTGQLLTAIEQAGGSICELGFPFSDPIADGPIIQNSMTHALSIGVKPRAIFEMVAQQRAKLNLGLVAMVSYSIVHRLGVQSFIKDAVEAGFDGFIIPDLSVEEAGPARDAIGKAGAVLSFLIAPATTPQRAQIIAQSCSGFIYLLARAGVTGERQQLPSDLGQRIGQLRQVSDLPIAVGFGVSNAQQVAQVVEVADAAIVGSAIMRRIAPLRGQNDRVITADIHGFVHELAQGLTSQPA